MKHLRLVAVTILGLSVSACGAMDVATRNAPLEILPEVMTPVAPAAPADVAFTAAPLDGDAAAPLAEPVSRAPVAALTLAAAPAPVQDDGPAGLAPQVTVTQINVQVPETLRISEANLYYPLGDIVWREDPRGNRYEQVRAIVQNGLERGTAGLSGPVPVVMDIEVLRFHSLSEKARYTVGGMHSIMFNLTLRHAQTGAVIAPTRKIDASFKAYGGSQAIDAENRGITQKVRITERLAGLIREELAAPGSTQKTASKGAKPVANARN